MEAMQHLASIQGQTHHFLVDSYNIHRLLIAGVTVASKFFSDVFYTNSRYAKVGGLPLAELNALELQFLLLNGFDLLVQAKEIQTYGNWILRSSLPPRQDVQIPPQIFYRDQRTVVKQTLGTAHHAKRGASSLLQQAKSISELPTTPGGSLIPMAVQQAGSTFEAEEAKSRPKASFRSASESSTSASESTLVPSESSVDTEKGGHADPETIDDDDGRHDDAVGSSKRPAKVSPSHGDSVMRGQREGERDSSDEDEGPEGHASSRRTGFASAPRSAISRSNTHHVSQRSHTPVAERSIEGHDDSQMNAPPPAGASSSRNERKEELQRLNARTREWTMQQRMHTPGDHEALQDPSQSPACSRSDADERENDMQGVIGSQTDDTSPRSQQQNVSGSRGDTEMAEHGSGLDLSWVHRSSGQVIPQ